jgi:hypothetical protein
LLYVTEELKSPVEWTAAMAVVEAHALDSRAEMFERFTAAVDDYITELSGSYPRRPVVDIVDTTPLGTRTKRGSPTRSLSQRSSSSSNAPRRSVPSASSTTA